MSQSSEPINDYYNSDLFFAVDVAERTSKAFENSRLSIYNSTGHFVPSEQPEKVFDDLEIFMNTDSSLSSSIQRIGSC